MVKYNSLGSKVFDVINYIWLLILAIITVLPFVHIIAGSFAAPEELIAKSFILIPTKFSFQAYEYIFSTNTLMRSLGVSVYITVVGTAINLLFTILTAYPLAHSNIVGRKGLMLMVIFTMLFSGGMIPTYLIVQQVGLMNKLGALIIPGAINAFNLIILKNFFQQLPPSLEESAKIDGCNDLVILLKIVLPLSMPSIAVLTIFYAVGHWNSYFNAILYINDSLKWPMQVLLRQIVIMSQGGFGDSTQFDKDAYIPPETVKMATIAISTIPILIIYPFLQKHFTKGILLGSVKG